MRITVGRLDYFVTIASRKLRPQLVKLWKSESKLITLETARNIVTNGAGVLMSDWTKMTASVINTHYIPIATEIWNKAAIETDNAISRSKKSEPNYLNSRNAAAGLRFIAARGAELVTDICETQRLVIQQILMLSLDAGFSVEKMTGILSGSVGLTQSQAGALFRVRAHLESQNATPSQIRNITDRYKNQMLDYRAERIVRTEMSKTVHTAQADVVRESVLSGDLSPQTHAVWVCAESDRSCEECMAKDGEIINIESIDSNSPPLHPNCMCTIAYES